MNRPPIVRYDMSLVEEAVLIGIARAPRELQRRFHGRRDAIYEHPDAEQRDARFEAFHGEWFTRLGLDGALHQALRERPAVLRAVAECRVLRARSRHSELADLVESEPGSPERALLIRLRPSSLVDAGALLPWLRRELIHVGDMLDPGFGYLPDLPRSEDGAGFDNLLRERYRVVWEATVAGRLLRDGLEGASARDRTWREFEGAFGHLGLEVGAAFDRWFGDPAPSHGAIVAFIATRRQERRDASA